MYQFCSAKQWKVIASLILLVSSLLPRDLALAYMTNQSAVVVVGQTTFSGRAANQGGVASDTSLRQPYGVTTNGTKLIVGDYVNNRVLIWNTIPTSSGVAADVVIGQTNFTNTSANQGGSADANTLSGPTQVAIAGSKLLVTDSTNNRVLIFNTIPTSHNTSADVVIGQPDMETVTSGTSQIKLKLPEAVSYDSVSGKLMISDWNNSRVLLYDSVPTTDGATADVVLGQADFDSGTANRGGSAAGNTLSQPYNAHIYENKLFVADAGNHRILIWNTVPTTDGASADLVIGQTGLTGASANQGGSVAANTLSAPADLIWDGTGSNLLVSDYNNQRVLVFNGIPTSNNASAVKAIGQPNLTSSSKNQGSDLTTAFANSLRNAAGGFGLTREHLIVADTGNNRILIYDNIGPDVSSLTPSDNATGVSTGGDLVITFDETTRAGTGTLTIKKSSDNSTIETITVSGALLSGNGSTELTLNPSTTLEDETSYYVVWTGNAFKDVSGNPTVEQTSATSWNFTTGDFTAPILSSKSPADGSTDVAVNGELVLVFNEAVQGGTGSITIKKSSDNSTIETIAANGNLLSGSGSATISINPSSTLDYSTAYYVTVGANAFKDDSGNHYLGISDTAVWNFTSLAQTPPSSGQSGGGGRRGSPGRGGAAPTRENTKTAAPVTEGMPTSPSSLSSDEPQTLSVHSEGGVIVLRDVPMHVWFTDYVQFVVEMGIASGYRDVHGDPLGLFGPGNPVTYAEIAKMALHAAHRDVDTVEIPMNTSARGQWSEKYIQRAEELQLSVYISSLEIDSPATRGAVIQTLLEVLDIPLDADAGSDYTDLSSSHPFAKAISTATRLGLLTGDTDATGHSIGTIRADDPINRAEVAKILQLILQGGNFSNGAAHED